MKPPKTAYAMSRNRTNVAISRAKHGMYILGNADQLAARSDMWRTIINELDADGAVGPALPISCKRHREITLVDTPDMLKMASPDGEHRSLDLTTDIRWMPAPL